MSAISAANAVSLAIQRTRDFLFRPFSWGTFLKLGLVAIVTEGLGSFHSSSRGGSAPHGPTVHSPFIFTPDRVAMIGAGIALALVLSIWLFYLITRLRFAYFHCLIHNTKLIRPGWALYRAPAMRFFGLNLLVGFFFLLVVALVAIPFVAGFWRLFHEIPPGGHVNVALLLALALPLIPVIIVLALTGLLADLVLRDWMLPHYALDDATAGEAWAEVWAHFMAEKKQFFVYALLRVVLPMAAMALVFMVLLIPGAILAGAFAAFGYGLHSAFAGATGGSALAGILLQAFFGLVAFALLLLAGICLGGPVSTGIREYALVFYGGRYQELENALYPPASA